MRRCRGVPRIRWEVRDAWGRGRRGRGEACGGVGGREVAELSRRIFIDLNRDFSVIRCVGDVFVAPLERGSEQLVESIAKLTCLSGAQKQVHGGQVALVLILDPHATKSTPLPRMAR